jgi:hypothetical protein
MLKYMVSTVIGIWIITTVAIYLFGWIEMVPPNIGFTILASALVSAGFWMLIIICVLIFLIAVSGIITLMEELIDLGDLD